MTTKACWGQPLSLVRLAGAIGERRVTGAAGKQGSSGACPALQRVAASYLRRVEAVGGLYPLFSFLSARKPILRPGSFFLGL